MSLLDNRNKLISNVDRDGSDLVEYCEADPRKKLLFITALVAAKQDISSNDLLTLILARLNLTQAFPQFLLGLGTPPESEHALGLQHGQSVSFIMYA